MTLDEFIERYRDRLLPAFVNLLTGTVGGEYGFVTRAALKGMLHRGSEPVVVSLPKPTIINLPEHLRGNLHDYDEYAAWCREHCRGGYILLSTYSMIFEHPTDAVHFKLRWWP